jgi:hypothetical protein
MSFVHPPKTDYEKMILRAVIGKLESNTSKRKPSRRDEIREYNSSHEYVQIPLRSRVAKSSFETHVVTQEGERYLRETTPVDLPTEDVD